MPPSLPSSSKRLQWAWRFCATAMLMTIVLPVAAMALLGGAFAGAVVLSVVALNTMRRHALHRIAGHGG